MKQKSKKQKSKFKDYHKTTTGKWVNLDHPNSVRKSKKQYTRKTKHKRSWE